MKRLWPTQARYCFHNGLITIVTPPRKHLYSGVICAGLRGGLPHFVIGAFDIDKIEEQPPFHIKARALGFGMTDEPRRFGPIGRAELTIG